MSETIRRRSDRTWRPAFLAGIALSLLYIVGGYVFGTLHSRGAGAIIALVIPFLFGIPIGWKSDAPDIASIALGAGFVAPTLLWAILSHAGEDIGPALTALLISAIVMPAAIFGIGCATIIKSVRTDGFSWPSPRGYLFLGIMIVPVFFIGRVATSQHDPRDVQPVVVTDAQLAALVQPQPGPSEADKNASAKHYLVGVTAFQAHDFKTAAKEWKAAVRLNPDNADAHNGLARLGMDTGK